MKKPSLKTQLARALDDLKVANASLKSAIEVKERVEEALVAATHRANALGAEVRKLCDTPPPPEEPVPLLLWCPSCGERHIDPPTPSAVGVGDEKIEWAGRPHRTHACQSCGMLWAPAVVPTVGVQFLPNKKL